MRLKKFESAGRKPLGVGVEKRVFVNPDNEGRVISEVREDMKKDTLRQLKGRYYLTKIAHLLLPRNIPDVYQAGESVEGKQTVDAERIFHTPGHARLQAHELGGMEQLREEVGEGRGKLNSELYRIGLSSNYDVFIANYTKDEAGNVYYLETFRPWKVDPKNQEFKHMLFDEEKLRDAIAGIAEETARKKCERYLERILALAEEEKRAFQG